MKKFLTRKGMFLAGAAVAFLCAVGAAMWMNGGRGQPDRGPRLPRPNEGISDSLEEPAEKDLAGVRAELAAEIEWLKKADLYENQKEANKHLSKAAQLLVSDKTLVRDVLDEVRKDPRPEVCKVLILCLGAARTEEARFGIYEVFLGTTDPQLKTLCMAALAITTDPSAGSRVRIDAPGVAVSLNVGPLREEALLQAVLNEWEFSQNAGAKAVLFEIVKASAPHSKLAADSVWKWVLDTPTEGQTLSRARQVSSALKENKTMQETLATVALDSSKPTTERKAAGEILHNWNVATERAVNLTLWKVLGAKDAKLPEKAFAFLSLETVDRKKVATEALVPLLASKQVDDDIRILAMKEIQERARKPAAMPTPANTETKKNGNNN